VTAEGVVRAGGGRELCWAQWGDPGAEPVLYCHGLPGSRRDLESPGLDGLLAAADRRLVAIDRPGFGGSTFQRGRQLDDWPADVMAVAGELGLERFAVLGYSSGGPYALACALALPERVTAAVLVSAAAPVDYPRWREGTGRADRLMMRASRLAPPLARLAVAAARRQAQRRPEAFSRQFDRELSPADRGVHADPAVRAALRALFLDATRNGVRGVVTDYAISARPWGAPLEDATVPVRLFHGDDDAVVPLHHAEWYASRIPGARLVVWHGVGHLHVAERWGIALAAL
jgi:pimeloyl-ACP methyl ester carboxylesterase